MEFMCVGLWILAAKFEFEDKTDVETARTILHQGLRANPHSKKLWLEVAHLSGVFTLLHFHFAHMYSTSTSGWSYCILIRCACMGGERERESLVI